jgi:hypothetical protein
LDLMTGFVAPCLAIFCSEFGPDSGWTGVVEAGLGLPLLRLPVGSLAGGPLALGFAAAQWMPLGVASMGEKGWVELAKSWAWASFFAIESQLHSFLGYVLLFHSGRAVCGAVCCD